MGSGLGISADFYAEALRNGLALMERCGTRIGFSRRETHWLKRWRPMLFKVVPHGTCIVKPVIVPAHVLIPEGATVYYKPHGFLKVIGDFYVDGHLVPMS